MRRLWNCGRGPALMVAGLALWTACGWARAGEGRSVAPILFLNYDATGRPSFDPAHLHAEAWNLWVTALKASGATVLSQTEVEPLLHRWRVRSASNLVPGFLDTLSSSLQAGDLLLADLVVCADRVQLTARDTELPTGRVVWAGAAEQSLGFGAAQPESAQAGWIEALGIVCRRMGASWARLPADSERSDVYLLPVRRRGVDPAAAILVTNCLLRSLLRADWRPEDPGLTFSRLLQAGIDPSIPDRRARAFLAEAAEQRCVLMAGDLISEDAHSTPGPAFEDEEPPGSPQLRSLPLSLSLRAIDVNSGDVVFAETEPVDNAPGRGLFGRAVNRSLGDRFQPTTDRLARAARRENGGS